MATGDDNKNLTAPIYTDVTQCLDSSLAVFYYTYGSKPNALPVRRNQCSMMPSDLRSGDAGTIELLAMEDQELTFAVEADHTNKILRLSFRGSMTSLDWLHDFNFRMTSVRNPVAKEQPGKLYHVRQTKRCGVHCGFRNYLFGGKQEESTPVTHSHAATCLAPKKLNDKQSCKYDRILRHISEQHRVYPDYEIQVTGHSMGGAMATLAAFLLASDGFQVTCISIASPRIGNGNFVRAFTELECAGKIRNLRVVNSDDVVTALPDTTYMAFGFGAHLIRQNFYLHTGVCLHMDEKHVPGLFFPKIRRENHALYDWTHRTKNLGKRALTLYRLAATNVPETHNPTEYQQRIRDAETLLKETTWESLYEQYVPRDSEKKRMDLMS